MYYDEYVQDITKETLKRVLKSLTKLENNNTEKPNGTSEVVAGNNFSKEYFQVHIELKDLLLHGKVVTNIYEFDIPDIEIVKSNIIDPYLQNVEFYANGYALVPKQVRRLSIMKSTSTVQENIRKQFNFDGGFNQRETTEIIHFREYYQDVTSELISQAKKKNEQASSLQKSGPNGSDDDKTSVFIVHGHDELAKTEAARFIEKLGLTAIILQEQASEGKTIIEKIESYSNVGFGIILYTPCDVGAVKTNEPKLLPRARQNVVFEHGYLIGKLGRKNVCALVKGDIEKPNDISGVVYVSMDAGHAWHLNVAKELKAAGYNIDMNRLY